MLLVQETLFLYDIYIQIFNNINTTKKTGCYFFSASIFIKELIHNNINLIIIIVYSLLKDLHKIIPE